MTNDSSSTRKIKDDESNSLKKKTVNGKGSSASGSVSNDMSGLRRSVREPSSSKQVSASQPSIRKSERLVKKIPASPVIKKKSERIKKQMTPGPLRRSDRGKKHSSSGSSGSKKSEKGSGTPDVKQMKGKKEKSLKQLTVETGEVSRKGDLKPACGKRKKMQRIKTAADGNGIEASKGGSMVKETSIDAESPIVDCSTQEKLQTPELVGSASIEKSLDLESGENSVPSKRKRNQMVVDDASATDARKDACTSSSDDVFSSSGCKTHDVPEMCVACSKRQRVDHDSQRQDICSCRTELSKDSHETTIPEDRGQLEDGAPTEFAEKCDVSTQGKDSSLSIQSDVNGKGCTICKLGGELIFCDGKDCKSRCHPSCLDRPLDDIPPGVWHCLRCVNKKIQEGVYTVSKGIESIWDAREAEVSDAEGWRKHTEYFVKYKGLAHIHNQWVPENQLLLEAQELVEEFKKKGLMVKWNEEWAVPQRLLKKRLLSFPVKINEYPSEDAGKISSCNYEWLVKWRGLDYENATWELENASFLSSFHGQNLIRDHENRQKKLKEAAIPVDKGKNGSLVKLSRLPSGGPLGMDISHLDTINKLREFWHKGQSAIVFDDQDRIMKIILYIISLSDVCQPFLIVTSSAALSQWESEFLRRAQSIDIVLYDGNRENRRKIRTLEFNEEGGRIMFHVLLSTLEAVIEDLEILKTLKWEAVILDECQQSRVSTQQIKMLHTDVKVLLYSSPIKDSVTEYLHLLSLLECHDDLANADGSKTDSIDNLCELKKSLSRYTACECNSKFVEFWVPSQISNVQLEQYCATLLSNSVSLCSNSKTDPVGVLRDILISTRKCCDHPYIVDPSLKGLITKDLPAVSFLDVGIKASGKLQLLEVLLTEMRNRQLRVLILFQSVGGSGRDSLGVGDILDDFLRERFGPDTYERVDGGAMLYKRRQAALNIFNKESGRFVFLLENRACLPSIRLSGVDTIIIFNSDWNPVNDERALHRISIDSRSKQIKIFRLYSSCTVEEKVLILAKQGLHPESKLQNISRATSDTLLMWGASYLLNRLDEFHSMSEPGISYEQSLLNKVVQEFLELLSKNGESHEEISNSLILEVQQKGGVYSSNLKLLGELQIQLSDKEHRQGLWTDLLVGRNPPWKYLSGPTQRHRKKVEYFDNSPKKTEGETFEAGKKRKKVVVGEGDSGIPTDNQSQCAPRSDPCGINSHTKEAPIVESVESTLPNAHESLHLLLKPDTSKLCETLELPDEVKLMVGRFLEYVVVNCQVNQITKGPATILQAFLISLCWSAASLLKRKINRKESLMLAKHNLNFSCSEEEADCLYSKFRPLKKKFKENKMESDFSRESISAAKDTTTGQPNVKESQPAPCISQNTNVENEMRSRNKKYTDEQTPQASNDKMAQEDKQKSLKKVQSLCKRRMEKLLEGQQRETEEFLRDYEDRRAVLESDHIRESAIVRELFSNNSAYRNDKLKVLDTDHAKKMEEHKREKEIGLKCLEANHLAAINDERQKAARWLGSVKYCAIEDKGQDGQRSYSGSKNDASLSRRLVEQQSPDKIVDNEHVSGIVPDASENIGRLPCEQIPSQLPEGLRNEIVSRVKSVEMETPAVKTDGANDRRNGVNFATPNSVENQNGKAKASASNHQNQVLPQEYSQSFVSTDFRDEYVRGEVPSLQPIEAEQNDQPNRDLPLADLLEHIEQIQPSLSTNAPLGNNEPSLPPASGPAHELLSDRGTPFLSAEVSCQLAEDPAERSDQAVSQAINDTEIPLVHEHLPNGDLNSSFQNTAEIPGQAILPTGENVGPSPGIDATGISHQQNQHDVPGASRLDQQPCRELNAFSLNAEELPQVVRNMIVSQGPNNLPLRAEPQVPSQILSSSPSYSGGDPLQNELERIRKETEQITKGHEDMKLRLKAEVEEIIAQLHKKYEAKLKEVEAAFLLKKNELDTNHNKALMNKMLADAFRSKCLDAGPSRPMVMQQAAPPGFTRQLHQSPLHPAPRPSFPVTVSSQDGPPASVSQQNMAPLLQPTPRAPLISASTSAGPPPPSRQSTAPPLQIVHQSAALFSSTPTPIRPPQINPITPSTGNHRVGREIRAPAPHLQPFLPSHPPIPSSLPTTSPLVTQAPPISANQTGSLYNNRSLQSNNNTARVSLTAPPGISTTPINSSSRSCMELLTDIHKQHGAHRLPNDLLPPLSESRLTFGSVDLSEFETQGVRVRVSSPPSAAICVSDDD